MTRRNALRTLQQMYSETNSHGVRRSAVRAARNAVNRMSLRGVQRLQGIGTQGGYVILRFADHHDRWFSGVGYESQTVRHRDVLRVGKF